jgi:hypothetical protein
LVWDDNSIKEAGFTIQRATNDTFTAGLTTFTVTPPDPTATGPITFTDDQIAPATRYYYRVVADGAVVGYGSQNFPTMKADSFSNTADALTGDAPLAAPTAPSGLTAITVAGPKVTLTWQDGADNETGFVVERCTVVAPATTCSGAFAQIAAPGPNSMGGVTTYDDATVAFGSSYLYQVAAFNATGTSLFDTLLSPVAVSAIPAAPTSFKVTVPKTPDAGGTTYTATLTWVSAAGPASFTIERATNLDFLGSTKITVNDGTARTLSDPGLLPKTVYYYRIRANNDAGGSSAWTNAKPFPIRTGK